jgi:hypothetical protein
MGVMADERITPPGWLPPVAPGTQAPGPPQPPAPPPRPTFAPPAARDAGARTQPSPPATSRNAQAVWALVLAVAGLTLLLVSLGTMFFLTLPCSAVAWWLASGARRQIEAGDTPYGAGQAVAALWIARIGVMAGVAAAVVLIVLVASGFDFEQFRDDLERELEQRRERDGDGDGSGVRTRLAGLSAAVGR